MAITPNGKFVYVTNTLGQTVSVIATASNTVVATIPVGSGVIFGGQPQGGAISPHGKFAYVTLTRDNAVSVITTASNTVAVDRIPVGSFPFGVAITPDGKFAYVANTGRYFQSRFFFTVSVIATASNTVVATIALDMGNAPKDVAITPDGKFVYVTNITSAAGTVKPASLS